MSTAVLTRLKSDLCSLEETSEFLTEDCVSKMSFVVLLEILERAVTDLAYLYDY